MPKTKVCIKCYKRKPAKSFYTDKYGKLTSSCKKCFLAYIKKYHKEHRRCRSFYKIPKSPPEPKLLPFACIKVNIPRKFILRCLREDEISRNERTKISQKMQEIEKNIDRLRSAKTIVDRVIIKHTELRSYSLK